jgi:hypothetical protein
MARYLTMQEFYDQLVAERETIKRWLKLAEEYYVTNNKLSGRSG